MPILPSTSIIVAVKDVFPEVGFRPMYSTRPSSNGMASHEYHVSSRKIPPEPFGKTAPIGVKEAPVKTKGSNASNNNFFIGRSFI